MFGLNRVFLLGRVTALDFRVGPSGREVATLSIAIASGHWSNGEWVERTDYHRVTATDPGIVATLRGLPAERHTLAIEGSLQPRRWVDRDNQEHHNTQIILDRIVFVSISQGTTDPTDSAKEG